MQRTSLNSAHLIMHSGSSVVPLSPGVALAGKNEK